MSTENHPVWSVYNLYRTSRLNIKYYSAKLHRIEQEITCMDIILFVTAPGSSVAGMWFLQNPLGVLIWKYLASIAALIAVIRPFLKRTRSIRNYEKLLAGYKALENDLEIIVEKIIQKQAYNSNIKNEFNKSLKRIGILKKNDKDNKENKKLKEKCTKEVLLELPTDNFYIPEN